MQLLVAHWRAAESLHFHRWCGGGTTWSVTWDFSDPQMHRAGLPELRATVRTFSEELTNTGGRLPTSLGALTALERFDLSINAVTGQLPVEFSNCRRVVHVNLSCNRLSAFRVRLRLRRLWLCLHCWRLTFLKQRPNRFLALQLRLWGNVPQFWVSRIASLLGSNEIVEKEQEVSSVEESLNRRLLSLLRRGVIERMWVNCCCWGTQCQHSCVFSVLCGKVGPLTLGEENGMS